MTFFLQTNELYHPPHQSCFLTPLKYLLAIHKLFKKWWRKRRRQHFLTETKKEKNKKPKISNVNKPSTKQLLSTVQELITLKYHTKEYPLSFNNFSLLMDNIIGDKNPLNSVKDMTDDIERVIRILDDTCQFLDSHSMKIRYTTFKKRLSGNFSGHELSESNSEESPNHS